MNEVATNSGDMLVWGIMFTLLVIVTIGLAIWDKKNRQE